VTILTDATGDATDMQPSHDVQQLSIAEPGGIGSGKIMFVLKMANLSSLPPDTYWPVQFNVGMTTYVARMSTVAPATTLAPAFEFYQGTWNTIVIGPTAADPASFFSADGTIAIVVPRSGIGNPGVGSNLTQFLVRISVFVGAGFVTPDNMPDSLTPSGSYTIVGSENCGGTTASPTPTPTPMATPPPAGHIGFENFEAPGILVNVTSSSQGRPLNTWDMTRANPRLGSIGSLRKIQ